MATTIYGPTPLFRTRAHLTGWAVFGCVVVSLNALSTPHRARQIGLVLLAAVVLAVVLRLLAPLGALEAEHPEPTLEMRQRFDRAAAMGVIGFVVVGVLDYLLR